YDIFVIDMQELGCGHKLPVSGNYITFVGKINGWKINVLPSDVIPDIQFRPITDRKHADILTLVDTAVINIPQFGSLPFGIPLPKLVPYGENTLLGPCFLFISPRSADTGIKTMCGNRIK